MASTIGSPSPQPPLPTSCSLLPPPSSMYVCMYVCMYPSIQYQSNYVCMYLFNYLSVYLPSIHILITYLSYLSTIYHLPISFFFWLSCSLRFFTAAQIHPILVPGPFFHFHLLNPPSSLLPVHPPDSQCMFCGRCELQVNLHQEVSSQTGSENP